MASVSGFLLEPRIFDYLKREKERLKPGEEFIIQTAMQNMMNDGQKIYGLEIKNGKFYDTGNKLEYLKTVVDFALKHDDIKKEFGEYLKSLKV